MITIIKNMLKTFFYVSVIVTILGAVLFSLQAYADGTKFHLIDLNSVYTDYMHFTYAKEPFLWDRSLVPTNRLDLHTDIDLFNGIGFANTMVHSETDLTQYRLVGLQYRMGAHVTPWADVYFEHFSQHLLDTAPISANTYDAVGVRFYLYKKDSNEKPTNSIFR